MRMLPVRLRVLCCLLVLASAALPAQAPNDPAARTGRVAIHASTPSELQAWDSTIDRMVRSRQLLVVDTRPDPDIDGRMHESLLQFHQGVPVYGGGLSRQTAQGLSVSIIGTLFEGISVDISPTLSAPDAVRGLADTTGGRLVGDGARLVIFPTADGGYRLAYRATMSDLKTHIVDATAGVVLWTTDEIYTQSQVGSGTGALGDRKKLSTTQVANGFRTHDQQRPAPIRTFDTLGSEVTFNRLLQPPGAAVDSDFAVDADNTWTNPAVVDAHVHSGWTEDYLFKQQNWTGVDNRRGTITAAVHSGLLNNAFFTPPPFGADGRGMFAYGRASSGVPMSALDVVAHEMMHGVTHSALTQRTGTGLLGIIVTTFGPTSVTSGGTTLSCDTTDAVFTDGTRFPLLCNAGRFTLGANHGGALHEGFSDIFGIATEFYHHPTGTGPLQADYKLGEDLTGFGPNRAADAPASLIAMPSSAGPLRYPDHASRAFTYVIAIAQGTRANPIALTLLPWTLQGNQLVTMPSSDSGGVHLNATILSHAFYLAIEGGRNATSGITVTGVGAANRVQIERAFFRAVTVLMPNAATMSTAALAVAQAAVDLYGANSAPALAARQAMQAVGLLP
jgi:Zn-dependent metalloprotease